MNYGRATFGKPSKQSENDTRDLYDYHAERPQNTYFINEMNEDMYYEREQKKGQGINKQVLINKLHFLSEQLYEVIFLKESVMSLVGEQRVKMGDFMRQLKKYLFQFGVKTEREALSKQSRRLNQSSVVQFNSSSSKMLSGDCNELQKMCEHLIKENQQIKQKYESMLIHYRSEIESLSTALSKSLEQATADQDTRQLKMLLRESQDKLKQEQSRFAERVKYLESQILQLEDEYIKEREGFQRQLDQHKQKQRQLSFQQSEIERKNILLIEREKLLTQREILVKQERTTLDRRQSKVSDYEHNQLRRQRQKVEQQKIHLKSQYYVSYDRLPEANVHINRFNNDTKSERERSSGGRLVNSRIDINARLREIEMERKNNYVGFAKNSRMSEAGCIRTERSSSKGRNQLIGVGYPSATRKETGTANVNLKLDSMLEELQRDLSDMK